jgi:outer membrane lipopolysaccharide assembly protein LptE/RlpB
MKSFTFNLIPFTLNLNAGGILLNQCRNIAFVLLCTVVLNACGYRFAGQGQYPRGVEKILIEVFENRTSNVGVERVVTNQVIFEFTRQREKSLTNRAEDADAILKGVIRTISTQTIARVGTEVASQREVVMTVDLQLVQQDGRQVLWSAKGISDRQAYDVVEGSSIATNQNETVAIARLSERISERIFSRLTNNF